MIVSVFTEMKIKQNVLPKTARCLSLMAFVMFRAGRCGQRGDCPFIGDLDVGEDEASWF